MSAPKPEDLTPSPEQIAEANRRFEAAANAICAKLVEQPITGQVQQTLIAFQRRMLHALTSLRYAYRVPEGRHECALILRVMYDLHLQVLYILTDAENLVDQYRAFVVVEQFELVKLVQESPTRLAARMRARADFPKARADREADYEKQKHRFLTKKGNKCRIHWYSGTLADLADKVGLRDEYDLMHMLLAQVVHSSSIAVVQPLMIPEPAYVHDGWVLTLRVLAAIADHQKIVLEDEHREWIDYVKNSLF